MIHTSLLFARVWANIWNDVCSWRMTNWSKIKNKLQPQSLPTLRLECVGCFLPTIWRTEASSVFGMLLPLLNPCMPVWRFYQSQAQPAVSGILTRPRRENKPAPTANSRENGVGLRSWHRLPASQRIDFLKSYCWISPGLKIHTGFISSPRSTQTPQVIWDMATVCPQNRDPA